MRGQRGRLSVQPLGYVKSAKVIFRRAKVFVLAEVCLPRCPHSDQPRVMFQRKAKLSCNGGRSATKNLRARQDCMPTSRKTDFRQVNETSAGLKITFVDMTYPGQRPELPSLSHHILLPSHNSYKFNIGKVLLIDFDICSNEFTLKIFSYSGQRRNGTLKPVTQGAPFQRDLTLSANCTVLLLIINGLKSI